MKRHNFNVDFDKDVLQNDAELMESIDFLLYKSSQNNRKYKIVEILRESYYDGVICLGRVMELEEIFHFDLRRFMLKNPYIYICEDAIRSKTITDVNKFIAKQVGTKYVHSRYPKIGFPQIRRILVEIHAILCLTQ